MSILRATSPVRFVFVHLNSRYIIVLAKIIRWILGRRLIIAGCYCGCLLVVSLGCFYGIATMGYVPDIDRHLDEVEWQTASHFLLDKITVP